MRRNIEKFSRDWKIPRDDEIPQDFSPINANAGSDETQPIWVGRLLEFHLDLGGSAVLIEEKTKLGGVGLKCLLCLLPQSVLH